jgi:hypothetical protein
MTFAVVPFALLALIPGLEFLLSVAHAAMQVLMIVLQWLAEMRWQCGSSLHPTSGPWLRPLSG